MAPGAANSHRPRVRTLAQVLALAFVVHVFVIPQLGGARAALDTVAGISPVLITLAIALEVGAILAYAQLTRFLFQPASRPALGVSFGVVLASMGVNHVIPGGAATTAAVNYRLFGLAGVSGSELGLILAIQAIGSAVVLNLLLWAALVVSIPTSGFHPIYATAAAVGAVLMAIFGFAVVGLLRGGDRLARWTQRAATLVPRVDPDRVEESLEVAASQLRILSEDRRRLRTAVGLATSNWLLDAAALWVFLTAFGHRTDVIGLLVAYGLANVMAAIPVTPGGLGVIEAVLIPTLVGFGTPASVAAIGVVAYRMVNFWLPIPTGLAAYVIVERHLAGKRATTGVRSVIAGLVNADEDEEPGT